MKLKNKEILVNGGIVLCKRSGYQDSYSLNKDQVIDALTGRYAAILVTYDDNGKKGTRTVNDFSNFKSKITQQRNKYFVFRY